MTLLEMLLAIGGIIVTLVLSLIGLFYVLRFRNKVKLTFIEEDCIPLFKTIAQNIDGLDILYKNNRITPSVIMLKGSMYNSGNIDIDKSKVHKPLSVKLPDSCKWLNAKITDFSEDIKLECEIKNDSFLEFRWDLLKKGEFFRFDSLIEASSDEDVSGALNFIQRITNLSKIEEKKLPSYSKLKETKSSFLRNAFFSCVCALVLITVIFFGDKALSKVNVHYFLNEKNETTIEANVVFQENNMIKVTNKKADLEVVFPPEELFSKYKIKTVPRPHRFPTELLIVFFIVFVFGAISDFIRYRKEKKLMILIRYVGEI